MAGLHCAPGTARQARPARGLAAALTALEAADAASLTTAIGSLRGPGGGLALLGAAARARRVKTWGDYGRELSDWAATLPRKS